MKFHTHITEQILSSGINVWQLERMRRGDRSLMLCCYCWWL